MVFSTPRGVPRFIRPSKPKSSSGPPFIALESGVVSNTPSDARTNGDHGPRVAGSSLRQEVGLRWGATNDRTSDEQTNAAQWGDKP